MSSFEEDEEQTQAEIDAEIAKLAEEAAKTGIDVKQRFKEEMEYKIVRDTWKNILFDDWSWGCCWGPPRKGKSTCLLQLAFTVYHDWDMVLNSVTFGAVGLIHKMEHHQPMRIWETVNRLHFRIPFLIYDDAGAGDNKSSTQHTEYFDLIKGAWDTYATQVANIWNSLNQPDELTRQLCNKYNAELFCYRRGIAKYDRTRWNQNFRGWQASQKKKWKQTFEFEKLPRDVLVQYDEMRTSIVDQLNQRIHDKMALTEVDRLMKLSQPEDYKLLEFIQTNGALTDHDVGKLPNREVLKRCKSRDLIFSRVDETRHSKYDLSELGIELLRQHEAKQQ